MERILRNRCKDTPPGTAKKMIVKFLKCNQNEAARIYREWRVAYMTNTGEW